MSSVRQPQPAACEALSLRLMRMRAGDLDEVLDIEYGVYPFPWTHGNFLDSIESGYETWIARAENAKLAAYFLLMMAVDEAHLLNITVAPAFQGKGVGRRMLDKIVELARAYGMQSVLLEVRPSNLRALHIYRQYGFAEIGVRKNYYPAPRETREDAIVMRRRV